MAVVGAGILGLAVARELLRRRPRLRVAVLEREPDIASHQTGHNSGVIHAGIYYAPGSLKAHLCVAGARQLYEYCDARGVTVERCGKVIIAASPEEVSRLDELERRGQANAVPGLRRIDRAQLAELEPHAAGQAALHSPDTGIVDFRAVARALAAEVGEAGGVIATGCEVGSVREGARELQLRHARGETAAAHAVFCAGAWADRLASAAGASADPRIVPFRGAYLRLRPERRHLVRGLIYPVPQPALPFLGVHLSRHIDGDVLLGPTALMVGARDAYRLRRVAAKDVLSALTWPGTWRLMRRWWRTGIAEIARATSRRLVVAGAARYVPDLAAADVLPAFAGVRAQALGRDGRLVDDFVVSHTPRALHVRNAPSPAATSALAIAGMIADRVEDAAGLAARPGRG